MKQIVTKMDGRGRVVIPVDFRRVLRLREGDAIAVRLDRGELRILTLVEAIKKSQEIVCRRTDGVGSLVDELIRDRRAETKRQ